MARVSGAALAKKAIATRKRGLRNLRQMQVLASAAHNVVTHRSKMTSGGLSHLGIEEYGELSRMVPEKMIAFQAAGLEMAQHMSSFAAQSARDAVHEWSALNTYGRAVTGCRGPVGLLMANSAGFWSWWARTAKRSLSLTEAVVSAQYAVTAPVLDAAMRNKRRLSV
jgi:hypothetical protein